MKTNKLIIISIILFLAGYSQAQKKVVFTYDDNGNRETRNVFLMTTPNPNTNDETHLKGALVDSVYNNLAGHDIIIYPNPTQGILKVKIPENLQQANGELQMCNIQGKIILQESNIGTITTIDISQYNNGIYLLKLVVNNETLEWKILKN